MLAALTASILAALRRREAGIDILAALAIVFALLLNEWLTAAVIALMLASGRTLEDYARARARSEMTALLSHAPREAIRLDAGGWISTPLDRVAAGDSLLVRHGEVIPVDGTLTSAAELDESTLTGESRCRACSPGEVVRSGAVNAGSPLEMVASASAADSTFSGIVRLVESAQRARSPAARLADRYALGFVGCTLLVAAGTWMASGEAMRALAVLVVATPCPLILAVPVAIVSGMSRCARRGVLIKDGAALEQLAVARTLFFDKTGTLTAGHARLVAIETGPAEIPERVLRLAASLAQASGHVISDALTCEAHARQLPLSAPQGVRETPGAGVVGIVDGHTVAIGSFDFVTATAPAAPWSERLVRRVAYEGASAVYVSKDGVMIGAIQMADRIRADTPRALRLLRREGVTRIEMLTGDRADVAETVGAILQVDAVHAGQTPADKLAAIQKARHDGPVMMVGDGVNDAPALATADVGIAMGAQGAAASSEAADVVLLVDRLDRLAEARRVAQRSRRIAIESVYMGMGLSLAAMGFAAIGALPPLAGAVLQEFIDIAAIANALRALRLPSTGPRSILSHDDADQFKREHAQLEPVIEQIRQLADEMPGLPATAVKFRLADLGERLTRQLIPHEKHDDRHVYPRLAPLLGGDDPLASMSAAHREIFHITRTLNHMANDMPAGGPDADWLREIQRILYGLYAIVRLHCEQEEELFHTLGDSA
ncbi:heavy metal translocating P-type ATPase [Paraburkholderia lycopersici]|uniref:P-type Zn(2+) transporter n=1 Tax=Paraburkholderia lycopersici TaxID=416944 RepID=A0A1G7CYJ4_9BURK|nr:heavy metal translocating P-type ATPase [Paraburkholderia lycopersici]SDE44303.1 ATPase, P-type (transporting), HAD superfamily, subfamily IC/heavy metal translocating P-type ATPase [Paraburkholderia lycopersici]